MSRRNASKIKFFQVVVHILVYTWYILLQYCTVLYSTVVTVNMTRYTTLTQKSYVKNGLKQENKKNGDGNVFQKPYKDW